MQHTLPSNNIDFLRSLIGRKIIKVSRQLFKNDVNQENYEQMADGPIEFVFDNNKVISFYSWTEVESVSITNVKMIQYGDSYIYNNLTDNLFWKHRVGEVITKIIIFKSIYGSEENPLEFAVEFEFENDTKVCIEYLNEGDFPDTLRVIEENEETRCTKTVLSNYR